MGFRDGPLEKVMGGGGGGGEDFKRCKIFFVHGEWKSFFYLMARIFFFHYVKLSYVTFITE